MRLGYCGSIDEMAKARDAGFDYLEANVQTLLKGEEPSSQWDRAAPDPTQFVLPIEAANCLVPGSRPIVGPSRNFVGLQDYMQRVAKRAQQLGIARLVFGSGAARKRPEGFNPQTAWDQLVEFTRMAGEMCAHHDVILVLEHLNRGETNTLNSLAEALRLRAQVDVPSVAVLVDNFHLGLEQESTQVLLEAQGVLRHVHVAEVAGRAQPGAVPPDAPAFDFDDFFCILRKIGYNERLSVEANWNPPMAEAGANCVNFLRQAWRHSGRAEC